MPVNLRAPLSEALARRDLTRLRLLGREAKERGVEAYLVGGSVRDLLLGVPLRDLDVVATGGGAALVAALARRAGGRARRLTRFGTAKIEFPDGSTLDLAAARREDYAGPAALPRVRGGTLEEDLQRRDFSINAMALDLAPRRFGRLIDPLQGAADLQARRLRALHDLSFVEDPTRAFRAARLSARLGLRVERRSGALIEAARAGGVFDRLSAARLRQAIVLLLEDHRVDRSARWMARFRLWETLHRELRPGPGCFEQLRRLELFWARHAAPAEGAGARRWVVGLGVLMESLDPGQHETLLARLNPPRREAGLLRIAVQESARVLSRLSRGRPLRPSRLHRCCRNLPLGVLLLAAVRAPGVGQRRRLLRYAIEGRAIRADIGGRELIRCGVAPGPAVAAGLDAALEAKLDGLAKTKARQLTVALRAASRT